MVYLDIEDGTLYTNPETPEPLESFVTWLFSTDISAQTVGQIARVLLLVISLVEDIDPAVEEILDEMVRAIFLWLENVDLGARVIGRTTINSSVSASATGQRTITSYC